MDDQMWCSSTGCLRVVETQQLVNPRPRPHPQGGKRSFGVFSVDYWLGPFKFFKLGDNFTSKIKIPVFLISLYIQGPLEVLGYSSSNRDLSLGRAHSVITKGEGVIG